MVGVVEGVAGMMVHCCPFGLVPKVLGHPDVVCKRQGLPFTQQQITIGL